MNLRSKSLYMFLGILTAVSVLGLTGCEQSYSIVTKKNSAKAKNTLTDVSSVPITNTFAEPTPIVILTPTVTPTPTVITPPIVIVPPKPVDNSVTEVFSTTTNQIKKIDFLFVIDNSGSMSDNQRRLAEGFQAFANTFFRRADLDICTMIITSDRYLGKETRRYSRERALPCTKPAGSVNWTSAQMQKHINALIYEFKQNANVGTKGSGAELLGKSLEIFLKDQSDAPFFRKDAVANISFVTDENNYFFDGTSTLPENNDLSPEVIKSNLDTFFSALNSSGELSYSTTSILQLDGAPNAIPGISVNLKQLASLVGRESKESNIAGSAKSYTDSYQSISDAIVLRASIFTLSNTVDGNQIKVRLLKSNSEKIGLVMNKDYKLINANTLTLNPSIVPLLSNGDRLEVTYKKLNQ